MKVDWKLKACRTSGAYRSVIRNMKKETRLSGKIIDNILMMYRLFTYTADKTYKPMTVNQFETLYQAGFNMPDVSWVHPLVSYFENKLKNCISPFAFVKLIDICLNGTLLEKMKLCFGVYSHFAGKLTKDRLERCCYRMLIGSNEEETEDLIADFVKFLFIKMDRDRDGIISFEDYSEAVQDSPWLLEFLGKIIPDPNVLMDFFG